MKRDQTHCPVAPAPEPYIDRPHRSDDSLTWALFCERAALEACAALRDQRAADTAWDDEPDAWDDDMQAMAADTFCACIPVIESTHTAQNFIACVARGLALNFISTERAGKLIYVAQTALSAYRR